METRQTPPPYRPIACASYEHYEMAILRRKRLRMTYHDDNDLREELVTPLDLQTTHGQEFLIVRHAGGDTARIRLDHIVTAEVEA